MAKLYDDNKAAVERMLLFSRDLREAYLLKEVFYKFMASKDKQEAIKYLKKFRIHAYVADIPEFKACLTILHNWEPIYLMLLLVLIPMDLLKVLTIQLKPLNELLMDIKTLKTLDVEYYIL